jgi:hypothetical protein
LKLGRHRPRFDLPALASWIRTKHRRLPRRFSLSDRTHFLLTTIKL